MEVHAPYELTIKPFYKGVGTTILTPQHTASVRYQTSGGAISSPHVWSVKAIGSINEDQQITHRESGGKHMR
jgi:hypothetical protein